MKYLAFKLFIALIFTPLLILFTQTSNTYAQGQFETDYSVSYTVTDIGKTIVNQQITLRNRTSNYYAESFELKIGSTKVDEVRAEDEVGPMESSVSFEDNVTIISVKFNQKVIGQGKTLPWKLYYTSDELAQKSGQIWEVSIPRLAESPDIGTYRAEIIAPISLGPVAFAVPTPKEQTRENLNQIFSFEKSQLTESGISMSFGEKQVFQFDLSYFIENTNLTSRITNITLPPDNNFQKVVFESIEPAPIDVETDTDGNFLAKFRLNPKEGREIKVKGYVEVFSKPFRKVAKSLSAEDKLKYTSPDKFWETDSASIKDKANEFINPKDIYDFVSNYLTYNEEKLNLTKIDRLGALAAYNSPTEAVCMEFTDLFIALARNAGIPAREVVGYAYTQNTRLRPLSFASQGDLLHAWPEYWSDELGWIQIDPTWGSTSGGLDYFSKLDFNHITLVQRGSSSTKPLPAGSFKKLGDEQKKDVIVEFAKELPQITATPQIEIITSERIISGIPAEVKARVKNIGSASILEGTLSLSSSKLTVATENPIKTEILPPFSDKVYIFKVESNSTLRAYGDTLVLSFNETETTKNVEIVPFYYLVLSPQFIVVLFSLAAIVSLGLILYGKIHKNSKIAETY